MGMCLVEKDSSCPVQITLMRFGVCCHKAKPHDRKRIPKILIEAHELLGKTYRLPAHHPEGADGEHSEDPPVLLVLLFDLSVGFSLLFFIF